MPRSDNYPEDIRQYDNDPRSPFYTEPNAWVHRACVDLVAAWLTEIDENNYIEALDWVRADVDAARGDMDLESFIYNEAFKYIEKYREDFEPTLGEED